MTKDLRLCKWRHDARRPVLVYYRSIGVSSVEPKDGRRMVAWSGFWEWIWKVKNKSKSEFEKQKIKVKVNLKGKKNESDFEKFKKKWKWFARKAKPASNPHARLKARPGKVDHRPTFELLLSFLSLLSFHRRPTQHVPILRSKDQGKVGSNQVPEPLCNVSSLDLTPTWCRLQVRSSRRSWICGVLGTRWPSLCRAGPEHRWSEKKKRWTPKPPKLMLLQFYSGVPESRACRNKTLSRFQHWILQRQALLPGAIEFNIGFWILENYLHWILNLSLARPYW